jgi:periplasmic divalent cation tolerance protein
MLMEILIVHIPTPTLDVAQKLATMLIEQQLIACANILQGQSMYIWDANLTCEEEWYLSCKTLPHKIQDVEQLILTIHPYDTPAVIHWGAKCNSSYFDWVSSLVF